MQRKTAMKDKRNDLLVIIPAFNEEENICQVVTNLIEKYPQYDYVIINDQLETALRQVEDVLDAESCRPSRWTQWLKQFREDAEQ